MASLAGLAAALTWAAASTLLAVALRSTSPPAVSAGRLFLLGSLQLMGLPFLLLTERPGLLPLVAIAGSALMGGGIGDSLYTAGLRHLGQATALPLASSLYPLATFFLGAALFGEELTPVTAVGALLVVGGALLVVYSRLRVLQPATDILAGHQRGRGLALVLVGTSLWVASALSMRWGIEGMNPVAAIAVRAPVSILLAVPMLYIAGPLYRSAPRRIFTRACVAAGLMSGVTSYLFLSGVRFGGVGRTTVLFSTSPLIGLAFSKSVLSEGVGVPTLAGTVAAVVGVILLVL